MFETPPLEINFLRKASSYAQDVLETSAFFQVTFRSIPVEKGPYSFLRLKTRFRNPGEVLVPQDSSPHQMEVLKYARDNFLTICMAIDVPEAGFGPRKNEIRNSHNNYTLQRQFVDCFHIVKSSPSTLLNHLYVQGAHFHSQAHNLRHNRALGEIQKFYKMFL